MAETAAIQVEAFERWWALRANWPREWAAVANEAFQAGAASRQGEVDALTRALARAMAVEQARRDGLIDE